FRLGTAWRSFEEIALGNTVFASTTNGESASAGEMAMHITQKSPTITRSGRVWKNAAGSSG
ncbi:MAG: hypothetical protein QGG89_16770, partial [Vicinamibacterales bacterium]|nr:hypothetical protein [Vicinamibacterales bacterium]